MCRLLAVRDAEPFPIAGQLAALAAIARGSKEYQGDGWGCSWWEGGEWKAYRSVTPIWEDRFDRFGDTRLLLAHARSAFRNEGIDVLNNMPFVEDGTAFVFNGELRGVRLQAEGRIGAEKLFHVFRRFGGDERTEALQRAVELVARRTTYVRAMNFVLATGTAVRIGCHYSEDPDYFTMYRKEMGARQIVSSEPFPGETGWIPMPNGTIVEWP